MALKFNDDAAQFNTPTSSSIGIRQACGSPCRLWTALVKGSINQVQEVLTKDPDAAHMPLMEHGWELPICAAIQFHCSHEVVKLLLEHRSDPNSVNFEGQSAFTLLYQQAQHCELALPRKQIKAASSSNEQTTFSSWQSKHLCLDLPTWDNMRQLAQGICLSREDRHLKIAGQLLKSGYVLANITAHACKNTLADDTNSSRFMRLVQDWPDTVTCGVLLCTLNQQWRGQTFKNCISTCYLLDHHCWMKVIGYVICINTWSATGLCFYMS